MTYVGTKNINLSNPANNNTSNAYYSDNSDLKNYCNNPYTLDRFGIGFTLPGPELVSDTFMNVRQAYPLIERDGATVVQENHYTVTNENQDLTKRTPFVSFGETANTENQNQMPTQQSMAAEVKAEREKLFKDKYGRHWQTMMMLEDLEESIEEQASVDESNALAVHTWPTEKPGYLDDRTLPLTERTSQIELGFQHESTAPLQQQIQNIEYGFQQSTVFRQSIGLPDSNILLEKPAEPQPVSNHNQTVGIKSLLKEQVKLICETLGIKLVNRTLGQKPY